MTKREYIREEFEPIYASGKDARAESYPLFGKIVGPTRKGTQWDSL